jgi:hypothetical protein
LLTLVWRGTKIDHEPGGHDDWANAVAGVVWLVAEENAGAEDYARLGRDDQPKPPTPEQVAAGAAHRDALAGREAMLAAERAWTTGGHARPDRLRVGDEPVVMMKFAQVCRFNAGYFTVYFPAYGAWPVPVRLAGHRWLISHGAVAVADPTPVEPAQESLPAPAASAPPVPFLGIVVR